MALKIVNPTTLLRRVQVMFPPFMDPDVASVRGYLLLDIGYLRLIQFDT